jgi:hypothetical protein
VASVGRFLGETRDSRRGSAQRIEAEAERGENGEGSRDRLERVEMEEGGGGTGDRQQHGSSGHGRRRGSRAEELNGAADQWGPTTVPSFKPVQPLNKFKHVQIYFK